VLEIDEAQAIAIYDDIRNKRRTTQYMHLPPVLAVDVPEIHA
jgi:NAD+ synthase